ncbi:MAG TPA: hypothetical protein VLH08_18755 [Acidobacteriota bacterium]|jgi:hypothetical protein|nr:hypothetical protein [Acidobacteriota bacterium]
MVQIKPSKWSSEWYELATTDELILSIKEVKHLLDINPKMAQRKRSQWEEKIQRLYSELGQRKTSGEDWEEP